MGDHGLDNSTDGRGGLAPTDAKPTRIFDLRERTAVFAEDVIRYCKLIPRNIITKPLISQLVRSATSVGANYCEAIEKLSRRDYRCKVGICTKESSESKYWLRMIVAAEPNQKDAARPLWLEAHELHLILAAIFRKVSDDD